MEKKETQESNAIQNPPKSRNWLKILIISAIVFKILSFIYESYYPTRDPNAILFQNDLINNQEYTFTLQLLNLESRQAESLIFQKQKYNFEKFNLIQTEIELSDKQLKDIEKLACWAKIEYKDNKGKTQKVQCHSKFTEILEERLNQGEMRIEGVISKSSRGEKKLHLSSKLHFYLIHDSNSYDKQDLTFKQIYSRNTKTSSTYLPFLDCLQFWTLRRDKLPVEKFSSENRPKIQIEFNNYWITKFEQVLKLYAAEQQTDSIFTDVGAMEEFKSILVDNTPLYLTILFSVNIFHTLFSLLAVKNRISFWNNLRSNSGLSARKYYTDVILQIVIVLYLIDNEASILVVIMTILESLVSFWIAFKFLRFEKRPDGKFPYYQLEQPKDALALQTMEYDKTATNFMSKILLPILTFYTLYSFYYNTSLTLYSFCLKTLVSFIYVIGFINMTPQIYINYKL